jgi:hypothetical protein
MDLPEQPERQREVATQALQPMVEGRDVVGDLAHVLERDARDLVALEQQEVRVRGLRALDLR